MKVLIIEDSKLYADLICHYLQGLADDIVVAVDWDDAKKHVNTRHDVAWFDLHIPKSREDRSPLHLEDMVLHIGEMRGKFDDTVIVVCSGWLDDNLSRRLYEVRADMVEHKTKVMSPEQIVSLVLMGIMRANTRSKNKERLMQILQKASKFIAEAYPKLIQKVADD